MDDLFLSSRVNVQEPVYDFLSDDSLRDDFFDIFKFNPLIKNSVRLNDDNRSPLAETMTSGCSHID